MPLVEPHMNSFAAESQDDGGGILKEGIRWSGYSSNSTEGFHYFNKQYGCTSVYQVTITPAYFCQTEKRKRKMKWLF